MPQTLDGLLIFLITLIPGVPGEVIYNALVGLDWREDKIRRSVRVVLISVSGLIVYVLAAYVTGLPMPRYVLPQTYQAPVTDHTLAVMALTYLGHAACSSCTAVLMAKAWSALASQNQQTAFPSAWDDFLRDKVGAHWVVVALTNGQAYAGMLETADEGVPRDERDMLLREPALYEDDANDYRSLEYQYLFISANLVDSVAVMYDAEADERVTPVNTYLTRPSPPDDEPAERRPEA
jgi:hypothetical protein